MITRKIKEIYICEHCDRRYFRKHACLKHEPVCKKNPENIPACFGCDHLTKAEEGSEDKFTVVTDYCKARKVTMHPITSAKKKGKLYGEVCMPKACELREDDITDVEMDYSFANSEEFKKMQEKFKVFLK